MQPTSLDYARPQNRPRVDPRIWLKIAYFCGGLPLVAGVATVTLYLLTYSKVFEVIGLFAILCGLLLVVIGGTAGLIWLFSTMRFTERRWWFQTVGAAALLLMNFPACVACIQVSQFWRFTVVNNGPMPATVTVSAKGRAGSRVVGPIAPGGRERLYWHLGDEGVSLDFTAKLGNKTSQGASDIYLGGNSGGADLTITVNPDGTLITP